MMSLFKLETTGQFARIGLPESLGALEATSFLVESKRWLEESVKVFVMDFARVSSIEREFYRAMIQFKAALKAVEGTIGSINISHRLHLQLATDGVEGAFRPLKDVKELLAEVGPKPPPSAAAGPSFNVAIVNPFIKATLQTLEIQCQTKAKGLKPGLKDGEMQNLAIAGVLSMTSDDFTGNIVLCFTEPVFLQIYGGMLGEKFDKITDEMVDAAGELLNIIYGMAKAELNDKGFTFQKAIPTVLYGEKLKVRQIGPGPAVVVPFETEAGLFRVEIELNPAGG